MSNGNKPVSASRGRPSKQDAKLLRERIQAAALGEFRQRGFAGSSIDGIARAAAASRTTIYALYTDKQTLFTEIVKATVTGADLAGHVAFDDRDPSVVLREAMVFLNQVYYRERNLEVIRLCIAEADRFPDLFEYIRDILAKSLIGLAEYFTRLHRDGRMICEDATRAALLFNMLSLGSLKPFFVRQDRLTNDEMIGHIDMALGIFMHGCYRAPPPNLAAAQR